jgi:hypothetical protein
MATNSPHQGTVPRFQPGERLNSAEFRDKLNQLASHIAARTPRPAVGTRLSWDTGGFSYSADKGGAGGGGSTCKQWVPSKVTTGGGGSALVFNDGTINGVLASNVFAELTYNPATALLYILATISTAGDGGITSFSISISASNPVTSADAENAPPSTFYFTLGTITTGVVKMAVCRNLHAKPNETRRSASTPAAVGAEPFKRWYNWQVVESHES